MANQWKIQAPLMQTLQEDFGLEMSAEIAIEQNEDLCGRHFKYETLSFAAGQAFDVSNCIFERCTFGELDFKRISFADCIFDKCEWSNVHLANATFQRVRFQNCRMTGLEMVRGVLMNTVFDNCMMDYLSLSETKLDRVLFSGCRLRESLWSEVRMPKVHFENADLCKAQWMRTPLAGIDMSSCLIDGWNISLFDLRGVKLTAAQVISLSGLLGVEIVS